MNVFGAIKSKITSVPQNISAGFKSLTSKEDDTPENYHCEDVNAHAGAELLNKFQDYWSILHEDAEINARKAEGVDSVINQLYLQIERENDSMTEILREASYLPELALSLQATMELISEIDSKATELESMLVGLHDICEEQEMKRNRALHLNELKLYQHRKQVEIEQVKAQLAHKHASKVQAHEVKLQENLREKHHLFEDTYSSAIEEYKIFGQTQLKRPGYMNPSSSQADPDLSNISLEQDNADLESFLDNTDEHKQSIEGENESGITSPESTEYPVTSSENAPAAPQEIQTGSAQEIHTVSSQEIQTGSPQEIQTVSSQEIQIGSLQENPAASSDNPPIAQEETQTVSSQDNPSASSENLPTDPEEIPKNDPEQMDNNNISDNIKSPD